MKNIILGFVALFTFVISATAQVSYVVSLNTTGLIGHPAGPFSVGFQLGDGSGTGDGNNIAVLSNFNFGAGGSSSGSPQAVGGASGSLETSVVMVDSQLVNLFSEGFTAGDTLTFTLTLTTNVDSGGVPDTFIFYILDSTGTPIPTLQGPPLNELLAIYLNSANPSVLTFATNSTQAPAAGGAPISITPQINIQLPLPPQSFAAYGTGTTCAALIFVGNAYTDSFNSSLGSYSETQQASYGNVGVSGNINLSGSATINGSISSNSASAGNCYDGEPSITLSGNANATGGYAQFSLPPSFPTPVPPTLGMQNYNFTSDASLPPGSYNSITISGNHTLTLSPGTYDVDSITLGNGSALGISPAGQVIMNVAGQHTFTPIIFWFGSTVNNAGVANSFQLVYGGHDPVLIAPGVSYFGVLYAPNSIVVLAGSQLYGAAVVKNFIALEGSAVHFDSNPTP